MSEEIKQEDVVVESATNVQEPVDNIEKLRKLQQIEMEAMNKRYDELFDELDAGGYFKQGYSDESVVQIPGKLFGSFVNFIQSQMQTLYAVGSTIEILQNTNQALITNVSNMTVRLMEQHKANVDIGSTTSMEELDKEDAKKHIKEVTHDASSKKKNSKKATGSEG